MARPLGLVPKFEICVSEAAAAGAAVCMLTPNMAPTARAMPSTQDFRDRDLDMRPLFRDGTAIAESAQSRDIQRLPASMGDVNTSTAASRDQQEIVYRRGDAPQLGGGERITVLLDASRCRGDAAQPRTHQVGCSASRPVVSMRQWSIRLAPPLIHGIRLRREECGS